MTINSRAKGARGEREFAAFMREHGYEAHRGQQFAGSADSPDVVHSIPGIHIEVKRVEALASVAEHRSSQAGRWLQGAHRHAS